MNRQQELWSGDFGDKYNTIADRILWENYTGVNLQNLMKDYFLTVRADHTVMDYGCGEGLLIKNMGELGFKNLSGMDINQKKIDENKEKYPNAKFYCSSIEEIKGKKYDISMHSGLLIHINPLELEGVMTKIYNNTNRYIFGLELSTPHPEELGSRSRDINWHGNVFSRRWCRKWQEMFPTLKVVKHKIINSRQKHQTETEVFLLEK
jgi:spore coat polysaccharide biosynthesis protein SpsF